jgi:PAS domain S-box-containing protein
MKLPLSDICTDIASYAAGRNREFLAHILRIAAMEAATNAPDDFFPFSGVRPEDLVVGLWDWDVPNNIRHLDDTGASLFGYSGKSEFSEQQLASRIHPDDVAEWRRKVLKTTVTGGIYAHEYRIIRNDGVVWIRAKGQCTLDKSGRPERFPGAMIDITPMRRMG